MWRSATATTLCVRAQSVMPCTRGADALAENGGGLVLIGRRHVSIRLPCQPSRIRPETAARGHGPLRVGTPAFARLLRASAGQASESHTPSPAASFGWTSQRVTHTRRLSRRSPHEQMGDGGPSPPHRASRRPVSRNRNLTSTRGMKKSTVRPRSWA